MTEDALTGGASGCPDDPQLSPQLKWDRANPKAKWAHMALASAIRRNLIERGPCEVCGAFHGIEGAVIHGHHDDYDRPMAVRWLCRLHHRQHHARAGNVGYPDTTLSDKVTP